MEGKPGTKNVRERRTGKEEKTGRQERPTAKNIKDGQTKQKRKKKQGEKKNVYKRKGKYITIYNLALAIAPSLEKKHVSFSTELPK